MIMAVYNDRSNRCGNFHTSDALRNELEALQGISGKE